MRQLTSLDLQFLALETPRIYGHVSGLAIYDPSTAPGGRLDHERVQALVAERLPLLPPFRWRLAPVPLGLDLPYWIDDPDFDLDFHVRELALTQPGTDEKLAEQVARIVARPLDRSRPLWELYVIDGLEGDRVALLTKIHHAVVDGVSGAEILGVLLDLDPGGRELPADPPAPADHVPPELEMLGRGLLGLPRQPLRALRALPRTASNLAHVPIVNAFPGAKTVGRAIARVGRADARLLEPPRLRPPQTPFNGRISPHRRFAFGSLPLDDVKTIKNEHGCTVNDVVVALCAGAVRQWLIEHDALPLVPLVAQVPVSVRTSEQMGTYGNRVSVMTAPLFTNEADPAKRLRRTHEALRGAKERHHALPAELLQDATQFIPPALAARAAQLTFALAGGRFARPIWNLVISNVPGPQVPLYCAGARLERHYPVSVIADGLGLNITVMSYCGSLDFGLVADREQIPDLWAMLEYLSDALDELRR